MRVHSSCIFVVARELKYFDQDQWIACPICDGSIRANRAAHEGLKPDWLVDESKHRLAEGTPGTSPMAGFEPSGRTSCLQILYRHAN
jgi:hypothetical protein